MTRQPTIPFLRPALPTSSSLRSYFEGIDQRRIYSNFGPLIKEFEERIVATLFGGVGYISTVANGTLGLILAINAVKRKGARYALVPSFTFAATPLAAMWCGLTPYFIDVRPGDWALEEESLQAALNSLGEDVAVVVPYATFGTSIELSFYETLHRSGTPVVIDAAPAAGAREAGSHFGKGASPAIVFSLHATKAFGIGEGGFVYSGDRTITEAVRTASNFGFDGDRVSVTLGLNAKLSEYGAAIGLASLNDLETNIVERRRLYDLYLEGFSASGLWDEGWEFHKYAGDGAPQFMSVLSPPETDRFDVVSRFARSGIETRSYFSPPCHLQPSFASARSGDMPRTEEVSSRVVSLPLWVGMTKGDVCRIVDAMRLVGRSMSSAGEGVLKADPR